VENGGVGRGFISRELLEAASIDDAFRCISRPHQAAGHNYQLMDLATTRIWNVEAASGNRMASQEILAPLDPAQVRSFFHANQYQLLAIPQPPYDSSLHRLKRYSEVVPPTSIHDALTILGDQHDRLYPLFHDALSHERGELSGWTLATVVFDLRNQHAVVYRGNPRHAQPTYVLNLGTLDLHPM